MQPNSIIQAAQDQSQNAYATAHPTPFNYNDLASTGSTIDQAKQALNTPAAGVTPAAPVQHGNFLTHLLPVGAGILGSLLSGVVDVGSGGLATALDPAIVGAFTAAGKAGENALEGQKVVQGNDLTAGLEGAAGQAGGQLLGKGVSALGGKLAGAGASRAAANEAATAAANEAAATKAGIEAQATAYKDVSPKLQQIYNAKDSLAHINNLGFDANNPENLVNVSNMSNDILNSNLDRGLANAEPVDLSNYNDLVKQRLGEEAGTLGSFNKVALSRGRMGYDNTPASKLLQQLENLGMGTAKTQANPQDVRELTTKLGALANDAKPTVSTTTGAIDPTQRATYNVLTNLRNDLKSTLYNRDSVNEALGQMEPNLTAEDVGGSQPLAEHLNNIIANAGKGGQNAAQDYLDEISRNININNLGQEGLKAGQLVTSTGAQGRALAEAGLPGTAEAVNSNAPSKILDAVGGGEMMLGHNPIAGGAIMAVNHLARNPAALQGAGGILKSIGTSALPGAAGVLTATSPNLVSGAASPASSVNTPEFNNEHSMLNQELNTFLQGAANPYAASAYTQSLPGIIQQVQKVNEAQAAAEDLARNFNLAGGGQGLIPSLLNRLGSTFTGGEAASYGGQAAADAQAIAQATGVPVQQVESSIPQLRQNQSAAQASLGNIQSLIQALMQPGAGNSTGVMGAVY